MKKYVSLLFCGVCALSISLLLCGCFPAVLIAQSAADEDLEDLEDLEESEDPWEDALEDALDSFNGDITNEDGSLKLHYWQVLDADGKTICTIDRVEGVRKVDELTQGDMGWKRADSVENKTPLFTYVYMQQKTVQTGQDPDEESEYEEVMRYTVFEDTDVLQMIILDNLSDELPASLVDLAGLEDLLTIYAKAPSETVEALRDPDQFAE